MVERNRICPPSQHISLAFTAQAAKIVLWGRSADRRKPRNSATGEFYVGQRTDLPFLQRLEAETAAWEREGVLAPGQRERILSRYRPTREAEEKAGPARFVATISTLGALLVGVGVLLFVASNWSQIPNVGRLAIIVGSLLTSYGMGFHLRFATGTYPRVGGALILLGTIIFGAGIFLVAQMYHVTVHYPNGPLMWGAGVVPLAYLLRQKSLIALAIVDFLVWLGMEVRFWVTDGGTMQFVVLYLMAGCFLWGVGLAQRGSARLKSVAEPYIVVGALVTFLGCFVLTFDVYREHFGSPALIPFYAVIAALFIASLAVRVYARTNEKLWETEIFALLAVMGAALYLALAYRSGGGEESTAFVLVVNLLFGAGVVGIITLGYFRSYPAYVNIGIVFFVLDVTARYFDLFWKLLPRSLFFIIGGLILLGGGVLLERKRRLILARFRLEEQP